MTIFPKIKKGFNKLGKMERIGSGIIRTVAGVVIAAGVALAGETDASPNSVTGFQSFGASSHSATPIILTAGPELGLVNGAQVLATHYSHSSHASHSSHVSHASHCSAFC